MFEVIKTKIKFRDIDETIRREEVEEPITLVDGLISEWQQDQVNSLTVKDSYVQSEDKIAA